MTFLYPGFLFALIALSIPVIIHLFNFRRFKKVYFTNVRFLREVKEETQSKSKLKHLLVLLSRLLALAFLILAFAQPYIPGNNTKVQQGDKAVSVYIDNSFSMDAAATDGRLLELAKNEAFRLADSYKATDVFQLLTNDFEGRHQRLVNREEFIDLVEELQLSPATRAISEVYTRQADLLNNSGIDNKRIFMIGDYQESVTDLENISQDTSIITTIIPLAAEEQSNVYIDSIWFETPIRQLNEQEKLTLRLVNRSDKLLENIPVQLFVNGQQMGLNSMTLQPNGFADSTITFTNSSAGIQHSELVIKDYPVVFDDHYYFSYEVAERIPVHVIESDPDPLDTMNTPLLSVFGNDAFFELSTSLESSIDYQSITSNNIIILNGLYQIPSGLDLNKFMNDGGSVVIFPALDIDIGSYNTFLQRAGANTILQLDTADTEVNRIFGEHDLFAGVIEDIPPNVDLPSLKNHYVFSSNVQSTEENLMRIRGGDAFLSKYSVGEGSLYVYAAGLTPEFGNVYKHWTFVTTVLRAAEFSYPTSVNYMTIGENNSVSIAKVFPGENIFEIVNNETGFKFTSEGHPQGNRTNLPIYDMITEAGNYGITLNETEIMGLGVNYDRKESDLACYTSTELSGILEGAGLEFSVVELTSGDMTTNYEELDSGKKLWKWCIISVLVLLAIEIALLRLWKTA